MKLAKGPRPWSIGVYALISLVIGTWDLLEGLLHLDALVASLNRAAPQFFWTHDIAVVLISASFTIVLIPLSAIWLFASKLARIVITIFAVFPSHRYLWCSLGGGCWPCRSMVGLASIHCDLVCSRATLHAERITMAGNEGICSH